MITPRGNDVAIVETFWTIDPISQQGTLADPTVVTFTVEDPDGVETSYVFGTDLNVTHPSTGRYVCLLSGPLPTGTYQYVCVGTGAVNATGYGSFMISETGVLAADEPDVAVAGPCQPWINGEDVALFDPGLGVGSDVWRLDDVAAVASQLAFELSGRQFQGVCQRLVRPCRDTCTCFGASPSLSLGPWFWAAAPWGVGPYGWGWRNECGDTCGCGYESIVRLAGYPVRQILEVKIDGQVVDPSQYRLDQRRRLVRLADLSGPQPVDRFWPACQDMTLPDTEMGTFSVSYTWGGDPPPLGKWAASQLAAELWKAMPANQGECKLPTKVTRIVRQGVTYERVASVADLLRAGSTGLQLVDAFIAQANPQKARRRSAVFTPDIQRFARQVGQ